MKKLLFTLFFAAAGTLTGWAEDVHISTAAQLQSFAERVNGGATTLNAFIDADIDAGNLTPIGTSSNPYTGTFNGQYHVIKLEINQSMDRVGLIGCVGGGAIIKNVIVTGTVQGKAYTAGVVGASKGSGTVTIENCGNEATVTGSDTNAAGIFGCNMNSDATIIINYCYNAGHITGSSDSAGISGWLGDKDGNFTVTSSYNIGEVTNPASDCCFARPVSGSYLDCTGLTGRVNGSWTAFSDEEIENKTMMTKDGNNARLNKTGDFWDQKGTKPLPVGFFGNNISVTTPSQLNLISERVNNISITNQNFELNADIDMSSVTDYWPIGTSDNKFSGELDGNEHTVTLSIDNGYENQGLFGIVTDGANIHDLIVDGSVKAAGKVAGIIGYADGGGTITLAKVINKAEIQSTGNSYANAAGLVGCAVNNTVVNATQCANIGGVSGQDGQCAAFAGWARDSGGGSPTKTTFTNCWNSGTINNMEYSNDLNANCNLYRNTGEVTATNCYDASATASRGQGTLLNTSAPASGELCFMLNGKDINTTTWRQVLGTDAYPVPFSSHAEMALQQNGSGWYEISEPWQLNWMAQAVNEKNSTYQNSNIKLTSDIDYSDYTNQAAMFGKRYNTYKGTFDGQFHTVTVAFNNVAERNPTEDDDERNQTALFRRVNGGTIKNLNVTGTITTDMQFAAGICSGIWDNGSILNCISDVTINDEYPSEGYSSSVKSDATHGGILAYVSNVDGEDNITVSNCLFSGTLNAPNRTGCTGVVGWTADNSKVHIKNCLVTGNLTLKNADSNGVISRSTADYGNNYYTCSVSGASIKKDNGTEASSKIGTGELCFLLNGSIQGGTGWYQNLSPNVVDANPIPFSTQKKVYRNQETPTAVYSNYNITLNDGKYQIYSPADLNSFSDLVNDGGTSSNAELKNNIDMSDIDYTPIGSTTNKYIGSFDGNNHSVTLAIDKPGEDYQGLFGVVTDGVLIQNVIVKGSVKGKNYVGGIVGGTNGGSSNAKKTDIWNCGNEATVTATGVNAGGILGVNMDGSASIILLNCYNTGAITGSESGALSGWLGGGWSNVRNCYNSGTLTIGDASGTAFGRNSGCFFINCFYTRSSGTCNNDSDNEDTSNGQPTEISDEAVTSGELCWKFVDNDGNPFTQDLSQAGHPTFGSEEVHAGKWFNDADYDVYYNQDDDDYTVYQLNLDEDNTKYELPDGANVTATNVSVARSITAGKWVGLCLPFGYDVIPSGWDVRELTSVNGTGDEECMIFTAATSIVAGKPYLVKVTGDDVSTISATDKTIVAAAQTVEESDVNMVGRFKKASINVGDYYITTDNKLKKLTGSSVNLKGFRAYFTLDGSGVKALSFDFEDNPDGISPLLTSPEEEGQIYNLAGQRIQKMQKGINIVNGRKVLK